MNVLEGIISTVAPPLCVNCEKEGSMLCLSCAKAVEPLPAACFRCGALDARGICAKCRYTTKLNAVFMACLYQGSVQNLVRSLKYDHCRIAVNPMTEIMNERLPRLGGNWYLMGLPSATTRVRARSFDHSKLLAEKFAKTVGYKYIEPVNRLGQSRQVGSKKLDRMNQLAHAFWVKNPRQVKGRNIIVVDDVITTGASVSALAQVLKKAGAKKVVAMSFAHKKLN